MNHASPRYRYSLRLLVPFLRALLGIRSSISRDAALLLKGASPLPRALNTQHIPPDAPFILVLNHYDRPGLGAWWGVAIVATAIAARRTREPRELHFVMAHEWWYPKGWERRIKQPLTRWAFGQIARAYGIATLPPVIDEYKGTGAIDVRRVLALTRGDNPELVGITPEGHTGADLALCNPPDGAGLFMLMLAHGTIPFLPAGIIEDEERRLTANFGAPFMLDVSRTLPRAERGRAAARQVMVQIGKLLPERMWGVYRGEIGNAMM